MILFYVYRRSLEQVFTDIADIYKSKSVVNIVDVIDRYKISHKELVSNLEKTKIVMSKVNKLLLFPDVQSAIWNHFNIDKSCQLPNFSEEMLYGATSEIIHHPSIPNTVISDLSSEKCFYEDLAKYQRRKIVEFNEQEAANHEE